VLQDELVERDELKKYKTVLVQQLHLSLVDALVPEELRSGEWFPQAPSSALSLAMLGGTHSPQLFSHTTGRRDILLGEPRSLDGHGGHQRAEDFIATPTLCQGKQAPRKPLSCSLLTWHLVSCVSCVVCVKKTLQQQDPRTFDRSVPDELIPFINAHSGQVPVHAHICFLSTRITICHGTNVPRVSWTAAIAKTGSFRGAQLHEPLV
jgi:hypothetical protein